MNQPNNQNQQQQQPKTRPQDIYVIMAGDEHDRPHIVKAIAAHNVLKDARKCEQLPLLRLADHNHVVVAFIPRPLPHEVNTGDAIKRGEPDRPKRSHEQVKFTEPISVAACWKENIHGDGAVDLQKFCAALAKQVTPLTIKHKKLSDGFLQLGWT
jgi:hypothetical protein